MFVGMAKNWVERNRSASVNWRLFLKICASWALTVPLSGALAAMLTAALRGTARE